MTWPQMTGLQFDPIMGIVSVASVSGSPLKSHFDTKIKENGFKGQPLISI